MMNISTTFGLGESTLQGGHFGHFHEMYVKYISTNVLHLIWVSFLVFGFDIFIFKKLMTSNII